ncbi:MAG: hypothetical protein IV100_08620 [Myxococcales bacterium]|nr:hypothetical protein [Myxococcales bacterium]
MFTDRHSAHVVELLTRLFLGMALGCGSASNAASSPPTDDVSRVDDVSGRAADVPPVDVVLPVELDSTPICTPSCPVTECGRADGCGSTCTACPRDLSCADCALQLRLAVLTRDAAGLPKTVALTLDYLPPEGVVLPTLADLRLRAVGDVTLLGVDAGPAILDAGKSLVGDPDTGEPFQILDGGVFRTVVLSPDDDTPIGTGRWLTWRFRLGAAFEPPSAPATFALTHDEALFAPPPADLPAGDPAAFTPVVIWPLPG